LYPICTTENAVNAVDIIVRQGEGTTNTPLDEEGNPAHYYEFEELFKGRKLIPISALYCIHFRFALASMTGRRSDELERYKQFLAGILSSDYGTDGWKANE